VLASVFAYAALGFLLYKALLLTIAFFRFLIAEPQYPLLILTSTIAVIIAFLLYALRTIARIYYGLAEILFGIVCICTSVPQGMTTPSTALIQVAGGMYIIVRGLDNLRAGLSEKPDHPLRHWWGLFFSEDTLMAAKRWILREQQQKTNNQPSPIYERLVARVGAEKNAQGEPQSIRAQTDLNEFADVDKCISSAAVVLKAKQLSDGHWAFAVEGDAGVTADYIILIYYLREGSSPNLLDKGAVYLRRLQAAHGGWAVNDGGDFDLDTSVRVYFALKISGQPIESECMRQARAAILAHGGAVDTGVSTRIVLALCAAFPWNDIPPMPPEIMLLPRWSPFHIFKIAYWARTILIPLTVTIALRRGSKARHELMIDELFVDPLDHSHELQKASHQLFSWFWLFKALEIIVRTLEPMFPLSLRTRSIDSAVSFVSERVNGETGLGGFFYATAAALVMFDALDYPHEHPIRAEARRAMMNFLIVEEHEMFCQPYTSPIRDTAIACHALLEVEGLPAGTGVPEALNWLASRQILDVRGDWSEQRPHLRPGGWSLQSTNPFYPDLDNTALVVAALNHAQPSQLSGLLQPILRGTEWMVGLQGRDGGWGTADADNAFYYLNNLPFAESGILVDPPTEDVTARCLSALGQLGETIATSSAVAAGVNFLKPTQLHDGSWFGRWGVNYIYGTWSALCALNLVGVSDDAVQVRKAVTWMISIQNSDGGWGEDARSYRLDYSGHEAAPSTATQTAWALLGLMAAGEASHPAVERGVGYLLGSRDDEGLWTDNRPNVMLSPFESYARHRGYSKYFPVWALARFRNLRMDGGRR
jgi:squalene-hopene/tetraprenyl-beta-curcumene cyclase